MTSGEGQRQRLADLPGQTVYDASDQKIGKIGQIWYDDETGQPEWTTVNTGMFGNSESFMPVNGLRSKARGQLRTPYSREQVRQAPHLDPSSGHLDASEEDRLYAHYVRIPGQRSGAESTRGEGSAQATGSQGAGSQTTGTQAAGTQAASGQSAGRQSTGDQSTGRQATGSAEATGRSASTEEVTRSEEHLRAHTEERESGRAKLRKYVVTEHEEVTVPVFHEEVRVEREPITEEERPAAGTELSDEEREIVLHEERPVAETETVPTERVRMTKERVGDNETVSGEVRQERVETEGDVSERNRTNE